MAREKLFKYVPSIIFVCSFLGLSAFFYFTSPDTLIELIGVENAYVLIFILAFIGGLTTFSGIPYHLVLITMAAGGMNPWILGICAGIGVILGDSTSYYIGTKGEDILPTGIYKTLQKMISFFMRYPKGLPWFFLFYACFIPLSNDFIVISMGIAKYPFWKVMVPLAIGNVFFNIMLGLLTIHAYSFVQALFL